MDHQPTLHEIRRLPVIPATAVHEKCARCCCGCCTYLALEIDAPRC